MGYYVKQAFAIFLYTVLGSMTSVVITLVPEDMNILTYVLLAGNLGLCMFVASLIYYREGIEAMQLRNSNDLEREIIIRTGEDRQINRKKEYGFIKGFTFGVIACVPLLVLLFLHTLVIVCGGTTTVFGAIANGIYYSVFAFFKVGTKGVFTMYTYYYTLFALPLLSCVTGIANYLGGRKTTKIHKNIDEHKKEIYG